MYKYWHYLKYVIRHKWFVMLECFKMGLYWRGIVHDLSKFLPDEFLPYARFFDPAKETIRDETGYYKPHNTGDPAFDWAWFLHAKRNRHHWQWWVLPIDRGGTKVLNMPRKDRMEMLADWLGAGKAQGTPHTRKWYQKNKRKLVLHIDTRAWIEIMLGLWDDE